jgi:adenylate cyclase
MTLRRVTGIGEPYSVYVQDKVEEAPEKLEHIIPVTFYRIEGKHNLQKAFYGGIVALAQDKAVLDTSAELKEYDNITIDVGEKLYSKVIDKTEEGFLIGFTSVPASYKRWLEVNKK